ncbi:MAG: dicarboxylate/amino acid:cation symporter [Acidobacteriota bacterium]
MMKFLKSLYVQVLIGIAAGVLLGFVAPERGAAMRPLGDGFIKLVKMLIAPIVFSTVVVGIAHMGAMKEVGRIGIRALIYFEVVSTVALILGMVVVNIVQPGRGLTIDPASLDLNAVASYTSASKGLTTTDFLLNIIPNTVVDAFARGEILQVLLFSVLFGLAALSLGPVVAPVVAIVDQLSRALFAIVGIVMRLAPLGAFGAMAFTVGRYGIGSLLSLGQLMAGMYVTCLVFIFVVLGGIARVTGFSLIRFLKYISEEILIVLGTSSSESALPKIMEKLERIGCPKPIVGLVIPTGYSFNLDGTSIYMTMGALFVAQASGVHLSFGQQLSVLGILLLTSKGAAAVTGAGFITLAATLSAFPNIPIAGLALLLGVDRFMSEARSITNLIGNAVATMVIARWEGTLDMARVAQVLARGVPEFDDPRLDTVAGEIAALRK